jgi:hypothetical protein
MVVSKKELGWLNKKTTQLKNKSLLYSKRPGYEI